MSTELKIAGLIIAFLLFALIIGYHVIRMMNRRHYPMGGMYPPMMGSYPEEGEKGGVPTAFYLVLLVLLAIGLITIPDHGDGPSGDDSELLRQVVFPAVSLKGSDQNYTPSKNRIPRAAPFRDYPYDLEEIGKSDGSPSSKNRPPVVEPRSTLIMPGPPPALFGYQIKCGSVMKYVKGALEDYRKDYPQATIFTFGNECEHKIVLYTAETRQELEQWKLRNARLPKGYTISLPQ